MLDRTVNAFTAVVDRLAVSRMAAVFTVFTVFSVGCLQSQTAPARSYYIYVASESADEVSLLRFTPGLGLAIEKVIPVGFWPAEMEGPHGINMAPDGTHWYLTLGHGIPFGRLLKYETGSDTLVQQVELGLFPATVDVTPIGDLAFVVNSNFHGEHVPSSVSVVDAGMMIELDRLETCTMPHGSRLNSVGTRHYSACMMDDQLVEIDVVSVEVSRRLDVSPPDGGVCSPTWAAPAPDDRLVYVMCNKSSEIVAVDVAAWQIVRRWSAPKAPYNAQVTPDGMRLLVTQKGSAEVSIWDLKTGDRVALLPSTRRITHGVSVSSDGRYAFISVEGVGGDPGTVDVVDLMTLENAASADIGRQAGGIVFWKIEGR